MNRILRTAAAAMAAVTLALCIAIFGGAFAPAAPAAATDAALPTGRLVLYAQDGTDGAPLPGVQVVIPEWDLCATTDETGTTGPLEGAVQVHAPSDALHPCTWGEVTVLAYCPGYVDYALFHLQVSAGETRNGPTLLLFPVGSTTGTDAFSIIEGPPRAWVNAVVDRYRPRE